MSFKPQFNTRLTVLPLMALGMAIASPSVQAQAQQQGLSLSLTLADYQEVQDKGQKSFVLDVENDSLLLKRDDGFYTSGNHLLQRTSLLSDGVLTTYSWTIGQDLYTASDIKLKPQQLSKYDHPYAGWLYLGLQKDQTTRSGEAYSFGLEFGCFGPCAGGEWTQTHLHRLLNQPLPQAWGTELKQEWGVVSKFAYAYPRLNLSKESDLQLRAAARLGNIFTDAGADLVWRWGALSALPSESASFIQARLGGRLVAYNATIQGAYFRQQELAVSPKRFVPEAELAYQYQGAQWQFWASIIRRGNEIEQMKNADGAQNFAKIQIGRRY